MQLHALMLVLLPAVDSLRSYLAKSACMLLVEMLDTFDTKLDAELEYLVRPLSALCPSACAHGRSILVNTQGAWEHTDRAWGRVYDGRCPCS